MLGLEQRGLVEWRAIRLDDLGRLHWVWQACTPGAMPSASVTPVPGEPFCSHKICRHLTGLLQILRHGFVMRQILSPSRAFWRGPLRPKIALESHK